MEYFLSIVFCFIVFCVYRLTKQNPFDRYLIRKGYRLRKMSFCRVNNLVQIEFRKSFTVEQFRLALYDCMYSFPDTKSITFGDLGRFGLRPDMFEYFRFECLDFSRTPDSDFNCLEPFHLPGTYIILPADTKEVPLRFCHSDIEQIAIPSTHFVPAREHITFPPDGEPIRVHSQFTIRVPEQVIDEYRNDPTWNSILLIDENEQLFHPVFYPYWGIVR